MSFLQNSHITGMEVLISSSAKSIVQTKKKINQVMIVATVKPWF